MLNSKNYIRLKLLILLMISFCFTVPVSAASLPRINFTVEQNYGNCQKLLKLLNKERSKYGLSPVSIDKTLTQNAITRAAELCVYIPQTSPHTRPNGKNRNTINSEVSYEICSEKYWPSNSVKVQTDNHIVQSELEQVIKGWMSSSAHRKGILLSSARSVGIACIRINGESNKSSSHYISAYHFVIEFSNRSARSIVKDTNRKSYTIKVSSLSKYIQPSYFYPSWTDFADKNHSVLRVAYTSPYNFSYYYVNPLCFKWTSSNKKVGTVSEKGVVKKHRNGSVTITATLKVNPSVKVKFKLRSKGSFLVGDNWNRYSQYI